jgi:hypothetical protein
MGNASGGRSAVKDVASCCGICRSSAATIEGVGAGLADQISARSLSEQAGSCRSRSMRASATLGSRAIDARSDRVLRGLMSR